MATILDLDSKSKIDGGRNRRAGGILNSTEKIAAVVVLIGLSAIAVHAVSAPGDQAGQPAWKGTITTENGDPSGTYIRTLGRFGQGPGEYQMPTSVFFDGNGDPIVADSSLFLISFTKDGLFKRRIGLKTIPSALFIGPNGSIIGIRDPDPGRGSLKYSIDIFDGEGVISRTLAEFAGEFRPEQRMIRRHWYSNRIVACQLPGDLFAYGFSGRYAIYLADAKGRSRLILSKDAERQKIAIREREATIREGIISSVGFGEPKESDVVFPEHRPFFRRIVADERGLIYAVGHGSILEQEKPFSIDIFSRDGVFLFRSALPFIPAAIKAGRAYEVHHDRDSGETAVVGYRIENWAQMKAGSD